MKAKNIELEDDREYSPREIHELFGGPPPATQNKMRMRGSFCPYIKRGRKIMILGADYRAYRLAQRRTSTSDDGRNRPGHAGNRAPAAP